VRTRNFRSAFRSALSLVIVDRRAARNSLQLSMEWKTPSEVAHAPTADCKGKQSHFIKECEKTARIFASVIGRRTPVIRSTHLGLEWTSASVTFVLDPTSLGCPGVNEIPETHTCPITPLPTAESMGGCSDVIVRASVNSNISTSSDCGSWSVLFRPDINCPGNFLLSHRKRLDNVLVKWGIVRSGTIFLRALPFFLASELRSQPAMLTWCCKKSRPDGGASS